MPAVDEKVLRDAVLEHMRAEAERDMDALRQQLDENVDYLIRTPAHPDDPTPHGHFVGKETYIAMWERLYRIFERYEIAVLDLFVDPRHGRAFIELQITATPFEEWLGLPAGQPVRWWPSAICTFDQAGRMLSETVFGSFPPIMDGYARAVTYNVERAGRSS
jgi:hypothetical protein